MSLTEETVWSARHFPSVKFVVRNKNINDSDTIVLLEGAEMHRHHLRTQAEIQTVM